jgi:hypothetical protein
MHYLKFFLSFLSYIKKTSYLYAKIFKKKSFEEAYLHNNKHNSFIVFVW